MLSADNKFIKLTTESQKTETLHLNGAFFYFSARERFTGSKMEGKEIFL